MTSQPGDSPPRSRPQTRSAPRLGLVTALRDLVSAGDVEGDGDLSVPDRLARAAAQVLAVDAVGISVYLGTDVVVPIGASGGAATTAERLQFTLAEGPCLQAYASNAPVLVPDIARPDSQAWSRWPTYAFELARRTPFRAVFVFPLRTGSQTMGSLSLFRQAPGPLSDVLGAGAIASWSTGRLLQAKMFTLDDASEPEWLDGPAYRRRQQVFMAQGLTMQANRLSPTQALEVLRAQAYSTDRLLDDLAADIVAGDLPVPVL